MNIVNTPQDFLVKTNHNYPPGNYMVFEEFFYNKFIEENPETDRIYLPIQWTCFYISRNYLQDSVDDLQSFLDSLPRDKKYFTIIQWDDGIKNNLKDLDVLIFSSGGIGDYPIPLINNPHNKTERNRDIFASFVGIINGRHRIREKLRDSLINNTDYRILENIGFDAFRETMERSIFSLCPRGYGKTSFRINESLNLGSIPVYVYDDPWIPFNDEIDFNTYGVLIHESQIQEIDKILKSISPDKILNLREKGSSIYNEYYSYLGCYNNIIKKLIHV
jgi:hypothetical protein